MSFARGAASRVRRRARVSAAVVAVLLAAGSAALPAAAASPLRDQEWYLGPLGMDQVWSISQGAGVTVAVLDSGVDGSVGDLRGALVPGFDAGDNGQDPAVAHDPEGHGTIMAARIAGRGTSPGLIGVAPQAKILPVVIPDTGDGATALVTAFHRLAGQAVAQVVNISEGWSGACPQDVQQAIKRAVDNGVIVVAAAGNDARAGNPSVYPANCKGVVAVGAYDRSGAAWSDSQRQPYVALGAPGVDLPAYNKQGTLGSVDGTSDSAAIVSGAFAVLRAHFPTMPSRQLVARMLATATRTYYHGPGYGRPGDVLGYGFALPHQALIKNVPATAPNPIYDALATVPDGAPGDSADPPTEHATSSTPTAPATTSAGEVPKANASSGSGGGSSAGGIIAGIAAVVVVVVGGGIVAARRRRTPTRLP